MKIELTYFFYFIGQNFFSAVLAFIPPAFYFDVFLITNNSYSPKNSFQTDVMFTFPRMFQFINFYYKELLLCHELLKYKMRYDLQCKLSLRSDFKCFTDILFALYLKGKSTKLPIPRMKLNRIDTSFSL